ncbi:MAG TPA: CBS domain-containing protein [Anaerolineae bacterium]|nr:CBS domain-containing protein [Anaerolineae bacterium]MCB0176697.1 CBS domain-containing protein [Anaerolineae bacterium]MCB0224395.1 CBS domain-containing protein [Anaerolineae bacterium]MCB9104088.1 CBS domain-containing protein [Anaerolineales bacterium]HRV91012.1 CBS domain-containing protein [Anaerolineae bacterium]
MLVKDVMTRHPIMVPPEMSAAEAEHIMTENLIRHLPVVGDGKKLVGLVTRQRFALKPDTMASLNVWEITRYLSNLTVQKIMLSAKAGEVYSIDSNRTVEQAARVMTEHKIGCLPVLDDDVVVGILSEIDLLRSLQEMLGLPTRGVRVTMRMPNKKGQFAALTTALSQHNLGIMGIGSFPTPRQPGFYDMVLKIPEVSMEQVREILSQVPEQEIVDIHEE